MRSKHEYELPAIKLDTPRDRYESAYRLVRFFDLNDQRDAVYSLLEMIFGAKLLSIATTHHEDLEIGDDYDPDLWTPDKSSFHERFKAARKARMTPEEREAERERIRSYTEFGGHNATFVIKDSISLSFDGFQTWTSSGPPPKMPERDKPSPGFDDFFSALWGVKPPPPKDE